MLLKAFAASMDVLWEMAGRPGLVVCALSGGMDSVSLFDLVWRWAGLPANKPELVAAHLNHGLRGEEADADEEFCRSLAESFGVPYYSKQVDVAGVAMENRLGVEEAGRRARHRFFFEVADGRDALVVTGHHADDQAETILLNLKRGAHRRGLCGMRALSSIPVLPDASLRIARPLLEFPRSEIQQYARSRRLAWREDASNQDVGFARNRVRHRIIPTLEALTPGFRDRLLAKAKIMSVVEGRLAAEGRKLVLNHSRREGGGKFFQLVPEAFASPETLLYALRHILEEEMGGRLPYGAALSRLSRLAESGTPGDSLSLPGKLQVRREPDGLFFYFPQQESAESPPEVMLPDPPFAIRVGGLTVEAAWLPVSGLPPGDDMLDPGVEWFNPAAIRWPLTLRPARSGERFRPLGAPGSRKIQDILVDLKVPRRKRPLARVLCDHAGAIWLWPYRLAHRVRLEGTMVKALRIGIREA